MAFVDPFSANARKDEFKVEYVPYLVLRRLKTDNQ